MKNKKPTKEWLAEEQSLKSEALLLMALSEVLKNEANANFEKVLQFTMQYPESKLESLPWDKREKMYARAEELEKKLKASHECLKKLDKDYEVLRVKVNKFYGKELLKKSAPLPLLEESDSDKEDSADWWKK